MNGSFQIVSVQLDPVAVDPRDIAMLQDLIVAAAHDAQEKVQSAIKDKMGPVLQNMNIPGLNLSGLLGAQ